MTVPEGDPLRPPEHLKAAHDVSVFDCGVPALDAWLKRRAWQNETSGASRTYVVRAHEQRVVGYYALATGAVSLRDAGARTRRNMPDPIPAMILGRLAIDHAYQGRGLGRGLLRDAVLRTIQAASIVGIRAILVYAISEDAAQFYGRCGFSQSPLDPMTLMITVADAEHSLSG